MNNRRFGRQVFAISFLLVVGAVVLTPIVSSNPNSHWDLRPTRVFPYIATPYWISRPGFFSKAYYALHLEQGYDQFYNSKTVKECLVAMDEVCFYERVLLKKFHYKPVDILNSCPSCAGKSLPALAETTQCLTPSTLPEGVIQYLKLLGVYEMVCRQIDHVFFVPDPKSYPDLFAFGFTVATENPVTKSVMISGPMANLSEAIMAAIIAHEAFHLQHNNDYNSYPESEKDAHAFETNFLQEILRLSPGTLTEAEKKKIAERINEHSM